jgi:outer membrane protein assembly factor BamB
MSNPQRRSQSNKFLAFLSAGCLLLCGLASAAPTITLSKRTGPPTSRILVSGHGFNPNVGVDIYFDTKDEALVVTNGQGEFKNSEINAPRTARPGDHWVTALERNNDRGAQRVFLVRTDWSQFHFEADGTRLNPYENVLNPNTVRNLELKWNFTARGFVECSPAAANGAIYLGGYKMHALNAATGAVLWRSTAGMGSSPAIANESVYEGSDSGAVYALSARTGAKLWSFTTGSYAQSSPAVANDVVYVGSDDHEVYALDAKTGTKLWNFTTGGGVFSSPTVVNGTVYVGSADHNVYALNAITGAELWSFATASSVGTSPAVANGVVYVGSDDKNVYALNASTGVRLWNYTTGDIMFSSPAVANGVVYVGAIDNNVYALNAATGAKLWSFTTGSGVLSSPAVANGVVYVGSDDHNVYALESDNGVLLWSYPTGGRVVSSPAVANGMMYVGSDDGNIYAFGLRQDREMRKAATKRPDPNTLRPDFSLKPSKPVATVSG